jgi:hypothetical protein
LAYAGYVGDKTPNFGLYLLDESKGDYFFEAAIEK